MKTRGIKALFSRLKGRGEQGPEHKGPIRSFRVVTLRETGMRFCVEYELLPKEDRAELSLYRLGFGGAEERTLEKRALCPADRALSLLNDCRLAAWDGFHGSHPPGVRDGIMFRLTAEVNENRRIQADGSENFPPHYRELRNGLKELLETEE